MTQHTILTSRHSHSRIEMEDGTISVSQSKVKTWRQCRLAFHYKYNEHLRPKRVKRPFTFGNIVHQMLEAHAEGDNPWVIMDELEIEQGDYFAREIEMYGNILDDIRVIMSDYFEHWGEKDVVYIRKNGRNSEHPFELELEPGLWVTGRVDATLRARKMRWIGENKTFSRTPSEDERWRSVQAAVYFRTYEILGWKPFDGVMWNYICSRPPPVPQILKSGDWSTRKITTLPTKLREFAKEKKMILPKDMMEEAYESRSKYFFREYRVVKPDAVEDIWQDFVSTAQEIAELYHRRPVKNIGRHCGWCEFEGLCRAEMQSLDVEWVKEKEYVVQTNDTPEPTEQLE